MHSQKRNGRLKVSVFYLITIKSAIFALPFAGADGLKIRQSIGLTFSITKLGGFFSTESGKVDAHVYLGVGTLHCLLCGFRQDPGYRIMLDCAALFYLTYYAKNRDCNRKR